MFVCHLFPSAWERGVRGGVERRVNFNSVELEVDLRSAFQQRNVRKTTGGLNPRCLFIAGSEKGLREGKEREKKANTNDPGGKRTSCMMGLQTALGSAAGVT